MQSGTVRNDHGDFQQSVNRLDQRIAGWMWRNGPLLARIALAIVFIWFGILKPLGKSTANDLVTRTVYWVDPAWF